MIIFNVLAKDLENAKEIYEIGGDRVLIGIMVKGLSIEEATNKVNEFMDNNIPVSLGLGAGDPNQWDKVANIGAITKPPHINQVFPAAGYTLGKLSMVSEENHIVNALIEPSDEIGQVYISTGPRSQRYKEKVSCGMAADMLLEIGLNSVKFYPIEGLNKIDHVREMAGVAANRGVRIFEPTGGINMDNVYEIVKVCKDAGMDTVIPHLYTSLIDKETGRTKPEYIEELIKMKW